MKVEITDDGPVVTMTSEELNIIRFALHEGVMKLQSAAAYHRQVRSQEATSATTTAASAKAASDALEEAIQVTLRKAPTA